MDHTLHTLKTSIENMSKYHQIEILRILSNETDICINENKNGTFINLSEQKKGLVDKLTKYSFYVDEQQQSLDKQEAEKQLLQKTFFTEFKDNNVS